MIKSPAIGEVRQGWEVGYKSDEKVIWQSCNRCGKARWERLSNPHPLCRSCVNHSSQVGKLGEKSANWKGGRYKQGLYITCWISRDDFFFPMADGRGQIKEHRLVMAKSLSRCLHKWEIVHHINRIKTDNRIENLQLVSDIGHKQISILERRIKLLETKVEEQGKFIKLLQWQIKGTKDDLVRDVWEGKQWQLR